jgi:hypothetical protein
MRNGHLKLITILTIILAISLTVVSYFGAFVPTTYEREVASLAAQGVGQDLVDLFFVVPMLLIALLFMYKNKKSAYLIFSGTVFYVLYSFFVYCFGVHFNNLFLLYCLTLGTSLYLFISVIVRISDMEIQIWFSDKLPVKSIGVFFIVIALMFYTLWLKDVVPAILNHTIPASVSDYNLLVNPVHVLDIAIALPGLIVTAVLLFRKNRFGLLFTPIFLVFIIILTIALAAMVIVVQQRGISNEGSVAGIFIFLAMISSVFLGLFLRRLKN